MGWTIHGATFPNHKNRINLLLFLCKYSSKNSVECQIAVERAAAKVILAGVTEF